MMKLSQIPELSKPNPLRLHALCCCVPLTKATTGLYRSLEVEYRPPCVARVREVRLVALAPISQRV